MKFNSGDTVKYSGSNKCVINAQVNNGGSLTCDGTVMGWLTLIEEPFMSYEPGDFMVLMKGQPKKKDCFLVRLFKIVTS